MPQYRRNLIVFAFQLTHTSRGDKSKSCCCLHFALCVDLSVSSTFCFYLESAEKSKNPGLCWKSYTSLHCGSPHMCEDKNVLKTILRKNYIRECIKYVKLILGIMCALRECVQQEWECHTKDRFEKPTKNVYIYENSKTISERRRPNEHWTNSERLLLMCTLAECEQRAMYENVCCTYDNDTRM